MPPAPSKPETAPPPGYAPLVAVRRGDRVESVHFGALAVADASGRILHSVGDPGTVSFLRSTAKPFQIIPVIQSGAADRYRLTTAELAVAAASHAGQDFHLEAVRSILAKAGLSEDFLMCGVHEPGHKATAQRLRDEGRRPTPLHCNCSGKHAAMLCLALHLGAPPEGYFRPEHAVQAAMLTAVSGITGVPEEKIALARDNCTVPTFGLPLSAAAAGYARLMEPAGFGNALRYAAHRAVEAMSARPEMVGGDGVLDTDLMRASQVDLIAKRGAEGYYGIGFRRDGKGYGVAVKLADGDGGRGRNTAILEIARGLSLIAPERLEALAAAHLPRLRDNRGEEVGRLEPCFRLDG